MGLKEGFLRPKREFFGRKKKYGLSVLRSRKMEKGIIRSGLRDNGR
jgi:hypothetical protein